MQLRGWWYAYLVSPLGTVVGVVAVILFLFSTNLRASLTMASLEAASFAVVMGVIISYFVGLLLLPVYLIFEKFHWRGWQAYLPSGLAAGVLFSVGDGPPYFSRPLTYYVLCGLCGTLCAGVFSMRLRATGPTGPHKEGPISIR